MENKELLITAIDNYPKINGSQKRLLKILVTSQQNLSAKEIIENIKLKKQGVYNNLNQLLHLKLIQKNKAKYSVFSINQDAMGEVINFYQENLDKVKKVPVNEMATLSNKISAYLVEKNIPRTIFGKSANLSGATITKILNGNTTNPTKATLFKIANVMGCSLDELFHQ